MTDPIHSQISNPDSERLHIALPIQPKSYL